MRVVVLGGGVVGVTTAYELNRSGHEVVLVDRQAALAMETSFANAGQVSPGYSSPWAAPGVPLKALRWLAMRHRPLVLWPRLDPRLYLWLARLLANCTEEAYRRNKGRMLRLAEYSRSVLHETRDALAIDYDHRELGTMQLFRTHRQLDGVPKDCAVLDAFGIPYEVLDEAGCRRHEPALAGVDGYVGALRLPNDETGDAHKFTQGLGAVCAAEGVAFRFGAEIRALEADKSGRIAAVELADGETLRGDAYVVALGSYTPALLRPLGIDLPICPVKGYSLTLDIVDAEASPVSTVMDETFKVAITRLGGRIRVGGTAELAGFSSALRKPRRATLLKSLNDFFPRGGDPASLRFWTGLRPMTPDGTPVVGATRIDNLYVNSGHGTLGWTMACGSARVVADLVSGREPEIAYRDLSLERQA